MKQKGRWYVALLTTDYWPYYIGATVFTLRIDDHHVVNDGVKHVSFQVLKLIISKEYLIQRVHFPENG